MIFAKYANFEVLTNRLETTHNMIGCLKILHRTFKSYLPGSRMSEAILTNFPLGRQLAAKVKIHMKQYPQTDQSEGSYCLVNAML